MRPILLQNQFNEGQKSDFPRNRMPPNSAWKLQDVILDLGAPARERGGWANASPSSTASAYVGGGIYATFSPTAGALPVNLFVDDAGNVVIFTASSSTAVGAGVTVLQNPIFHGGVAASAASAIYTGLIIIPDGTGAAVPKKYDGTTLSNLGGSPPKARYAVVYKDYTMLANGTVGSTQFPNRVWFSPPGDPDCFGTSGITAWDTTDSWIDFSLPVRGLASTKNVVFVFGDGQVSRIRGNTAPPDEDMIVDDPWQKVGLLDARSITTYQDVVYWAAPEGIFRSDGVYLDDITAKGGMLRHWLDLTAQATTSWSVATGVIRNKLIIVVMDGTTFKDAFMVDLTTYAWTQITNLKTLAIWDGSTGIGDETFFGRRDAKRAARLGTIFTGVGDATYKADGDGTAVASVIETPFYDMGRPGIKTVKGLHVGYHLADLATDGPTIAVSYTTTPESTSYTSLGSLVENTEYDRRRLQLGGRFWGLGLKFTRSGAGDFYGYDLSAETSFQEESKRKS